MIDIKGFENHLYEEELSHNTIESYVFGLKKYKEMYDEITKPNLIEYKKFLIENYAPQTVNLRITALLKYCDFKGVPMKLKQVKPPKKTHIDNVITVEQFEKLIDGLKKDNNIRWVAHIMLLAKTGMRISEALKVTKQDLINGSVTMHTKAHMRTIYFPKSLIEDLTPYISKMRGNERIMQNHNGEPLTSRGVSGELKKYALKYGLPTEVAHPHAFRHFFAIEFLKRNNNIALLADLLGHSNVNITQIYLRQSQEQQKEALDKAVNW